jgi:hypothetical protein
MSASDAPSTRWALLALLVLLPLVAANAPPEPPLPPSGGDPPPLPACDHCNLLIVVVDTLRVDHLGYAGYARPTSPAIDTFAAGARRFDRCVAQATWTVPSTASLLCSAYPGTHQLVYGPGDTEAWTSLGEEVTTLTEVLDEAGYETTALIGNPVLRPRLGLDRGFDHYSLQSDEEVIADAARQLVGWGEGNAFLYLHLFGPHPGLDPPPPFDTLFGPAAGPMPDGGLSYQHLRECSPALKSAYQAWYRNLYDASIRYTDKMLGDLFALLRATGVQDDTVIVLTSDHGEHLFDHGLLGHGMSVFEPLSHVPLVIRVPGDETREVSAVVEQVDLAPSLLDVLGIPVDPAWRWDGDSLGAGGLGFCQQGPRESVRDARFKLIVDRSTGTEVLHDLELDPDETTDFGHRNTPARDNLRDEMRRWRAGFDTGFTPVPMTLDPDEIERLRALGYVQ